MSVAKLTSALLNAADALDEEPDVLGVTAVEQALTKMVLPTIATITRIFRGVYIRNPIRRKKRDNGVAAGEATYLTPEFGRATECLIRFC